jgi:hypothetical protein
MEATQILIKVASAHNESALNTVAVYQDTRSQEWIRELWDRVTQIMGDQALAHASWSIAELDRPEFLSEAVSAAALADVLVVSIHAGEQLPSRLCGWIDAWLPRRQRQEGALIALMGVSAGQPDASSGKLEKYLRAVAHRGRLDFQLREHITASAKSATAFPKTNSRLERKRS